MRPRSFDRGNRNWGRVGTGRCAQFSNRFRVRTAEPRFFNNLKINPLTLVRLAYVDRPVFRLFTFLKVSEQVIEIEVSAFNSVSNSAGTIASALDLRSFSFRNLY